jgi:hypothetical protein
LSSYSCGNARHIYVSSHYHGQFPNDLYSKKYCTIIQKIKGVLSAFYDAISNQFGSPFVDDDCYNLDNPFGLFYEVGAAVFTDRLKEKSLWAQCWNEENCVLTTGDGMFTMQFGLMMVFLTLASQYMKII